MIKIRNKIVPVLAVSLTVLIAGWMIFKTPTVRRQPASFVEEVPIVSVDWTYEEIPVQRLGSPVWIKELRLSGVIFSDFANRATAVIKDTLNKSQGYYNIGNIIREAKIVGISLDRVELFKDGRREMLFIADSDEEISPADDEDFVRIVSDTEWIVKREALLNKVEGIGEIIKGVKITPVVSVGSIKGFRINNINEDSILSSAGIKEGDIIKRVNGKEINSIFSAFKIYKQIRNEPLIKIEIERENQPSVLTYRMD